MSREEATLLTADDSNKTFYVHNTCRFHSHSRRETLQLRCFTFGIVVAIFTMTLIVTISYSVQHSTDDDPDDFSNLTEPTSVASTNVTLKLGLTPRSDSHRLLANTGVFDTFGSLTLSTEELQDGLQAGEEAMQRRLAADIAVLASPLPSPSPELRHRYAVRTSAGVGPLARAAVAEIAATRKIESIRSILGQASCIGSFFDGGWTPKSNCKEFFRANCKIGRYRTFDGTCNRPKEWGSSMSPFRRTLPADYSDGFEQPRKAKSGKDLPSARAISLKVHKPSPSTNPSFTVMLAVFGQFLDHDITATAISQGINGSSISCCPSSVGHPECFPVPVGSGDPVYDVTGRTCMEFVRSAPAPGCKLGPREQLTQVSAFVDGSAIYGTDLKTANDLREFIGGRLQMQTTPDNRTLLPPSTNPNDGCNQEIERLRGRYCFAAGDGRANENLHLTTMHLLWARQHNRLADELGKLNPNWTDERIYQEARRIVGAQLQHITYQEFIPIVLGKEEAQSRNLQPLKTGYRLAADNPDSLSNDPTIANNFATAAFRFAHTLLPGLMKVTDAQKGTSSYVELHRMLFNPYSLYSRGGVESSVMSATGNVIQRTSPHVTSQLTNHLFEDPMGNVTVPCGLDLVSLNIQRGRDHGLPGYIKWREYCDLGKVSSFADLDGHLDSQALKEIAGLYENVDDVDLYTGALAEIPKSGGIVGPTFTCLLGEQFERLQKGDRYWYELSTQPYTFTEEQLQELRKTSLASLICDCSDDVTEIQANVMRSIGADNPSISCEDIPKPSLSLWKENGSDGPLSMGTALPVKWSVFKDAINDTIREIVMYINNTTVAISPVMKSDWILFENDMNDTFTQLRDDLVSLRSAYQAFESSAVRDSTSSYDNNYVLQEVGDDSPIQEDWLDFEFHLSKWLNDSLGSFTIALPSAAEWTALRMNIKDQLIDVKNQIAAISTDVLDKLASRTEFIAKGVPDARELVIREAVFDWIKLKGDILRSMDNTLSGITGTLPPPGEQFWAAFGSDVRDRYTAIRSKLISDKNTVSQKLLADSATPPTDWSSINGDILRTVNDYVKRIESGMPSPDDPSWASYRGKSMGDFSKFKSTSSATGNDNSNLKISRYDSGLTASDKASSSLRVSAFTDKQLENLINDWVEFRGKINNSATVAVQNLKDKKPLDLGVAGWIVYRESVKNDFAKLKELVASLKAKWLIQSNGKDLKVKVNRTVRVDLLKAREKFDYSKHMPTIIAAADWTAFENKVNKTILIFLNTFNGTEKIDWSNVTETYRTSFINLKNDIASLRNIILDSIHTTKLNTSVNTLDTVALDWIEFRGLLNSTINDFVKRLKNVTNTSMIDLMIIVSHTKDKFAKLELPPIVIEPTFRADLKAYYSVVNKTLSEILEKVNDTKNSMAMLKTADPFRLPSSSANLPSLLFTRWLSLTLLTFISCNANTL